MNHNMLWLVSPAEPQFCQSYKLHCYLNRCNGRSQIVTAGSIAMERTSDRRFLSQMIVHQRVSEGDWSYFYLDSLPGWGHGEVPTGFPLRQAILDYAPDQMFISDRNRWRTAPKKR
jgi:hypothetical protein